MQNLNTEQSPYSSSVRRQQKLRAGALTPQSIPCFEGQSPHNRTYLWSTSSSKQQHNSKQHNMKESLVQQKQTIISIGKVTMAENGSFNQMCMLHSKPADLVCLQENCIICSNCALFGKHKGHDIMNREGILTEFTNYIEKCLVIYDDVKDIRGGFNRQMCSDNWEKLLLESKQKNVAKIFDKFENLYKSLKIIQKKQLLKLNQYYKQKDQTFKQYVLPKITQVENKIQKWCTKIESLGQLMSSTDNLQAIVKCLPYINDKKCIGSSLIQQGEVLADNLDQIEYRICQFLNQQQCKQEISFDEEIVKVFDGFCTIKKQSNQRIKQMFEDNETCNSPGTSPIRRVNENECGGCKDNQNGCKNSIQQQNLLISVQRGNNSENVCQRTLPSLLGVNFIGQELSPNRLQYLTISNIRPSQFLEQPQQRQKELKDIVNLYSQNINELTHTEIQRKKKKIGFPQKFKGVVDDLKNDRAQTIDLTGAEAGDGSILSLCNYIKRSKKLKILKLVKNKLTDDCLQQLIKAISQTKITTLNLSQNSLTDKSCSILLQCPITNLKTITLSLNKINRRNAKVKLDGLAKKSVAILL